MAQALEGKAIDIAELCSTQPAIGQFGFTVLEDDKDTQPAENIAAVVRDDYLAKVGDAAAFQALLDAVTGEAHDRRADEARRRDPGRPQGHPRSRHASG